MPFYTKLKLNFYYKRFSFFMKYLIYVYVNQTRNFNREDNSPSFAVNQSLNAHPNI